MTKIIKNNKKLSRVHKSIPLKYLGVQETLNQLIPVRGQSCSGDDLMRRLKNQELLLIGSEDFIRIDIPDYTDPATIANMNKQYVDTKISNQDMRIKVGNYYERWDFEFLAWDSIVDIICRDKTLEQLLKEIYNKYPVLVLSFIFRKSIVQILDKLKSMKLKVEHSNILQNKIDIKADVTISPELFKIVFHQTEKRELEEWFVQNHGYKTMNFDTVNLVDIDVISFVRGYIENEDWETLFKFLICLCNLLVIPYILTPNDDNCDLLFCMTRTLLDQRMQCVQHKRAKLFMKNLLIGGR